MLPLILNSDIADIYCAARDCREFTLYLQGRGIDCTGPEVFRALLRSTPWRRVIWGQAPWRRVAWNLDR